MNQEFQDCPQPQQNPESFTILERIANGDESAVNECLTVYSNLIWSLAKKATRTRADAEDMVQDIFIDIWKNTGRFDPAKSPEVTFVILIAKRRLIDHLRKTSSRIQTLPFEKKHEAIAGYSHQQLHNSVETRYLFEALNRLEGRQLLFIDMQIFGGMSHNEIAEKVKMPLGTVKTHIRRGLQQMRKYLSLPVVIEQ